MQGECPSTLLWRNEEGDSPSRRCGEFQVRGINVLVWGTREYLGKLDLLETDNDKGQDKVKGRGACRTRELAQHRLANSTDPI